MTNNLMENHVLKIETEVESHPAWHGCLAGLEAEDALKGQAPFTYLIRSGEKGSNYYISFVLADSTIKHQPFWVRNSAQGWYYRNFCGRGPLDIPFSDVIHSIMHCGADECRPLKTT